MRSVASQPCRGCGGVKVSANVVAPYAMVTDATGFHMVPSVNVVAVSACPTCDRPKCNNAGCGLPTGDLLPFGQRDITPIVCEHCTRPIVFKGPRG